MPLLTLPQSAVQSGYSVELLESLTRRCPKSGDDRILPVQVEDGAVVIDQAELEDYRRYLREPWPKPPSGARPHIPKAIRDDVRAECHFECAICGRGDHGELAHIDSVATTLDNSPDNLLVLCPNHHSAYDYGHRPAANLDHGDVLAAKRVKGMSRRRTLLYESNVAAATRAALTFVRGLVAEARSSGSNARRETIVTELTAQLRALPDLTADAQEEAARDEDFAAENAELLSAAAAVNSITQQTKVGPLDEQRAYAIADEVVSVSQEAIGLDATECPHCGGRGLTGLMGDLCVFCRGTQFVTEARAREYDPAAIDEVDCPRCTGTGLTGLNSRVCPYCLGRQRIGTEQAEQFDKGTLDEVRCPRCFGRGTVGLNFDICPVCDGDQVVTQERAVQFHSDGANEVDCPHCSGRGTIGLNSLVCPVCGGRQRLAQERAARHDPEDVDQVECPWCRGRGLAGISSEPCQACGGDTVVSRDKARRLAAEASRRYGDG